jgi:hypothetical protein
MTRYSPVAGSSFGLFFSSLVAILAPLMR